MHTVELFQHRNLILRLFLYKEIVKRSTFALLQTPKRSRSRILDCCDNFFGRLESTPIADRKNILVHVKSTCKLIEKKGWKIENIWPGVDPNILATGGATTGYANTGRSVPRSNPGDFSTQTL